MKRRSFRAGDWFVVPLDQGWSSWGRVARKSGNGSVALCYLFAPTPERTDLPPPALGPHDAVLIVRTDGFALRGGYWPLVEATSAWDPSDWPVPLFARIHLDGRAWLVSYDDDDLEQAANVTETSSESARHYLPDSFLPRAAVEGSLSALIPSHARDDDLGTNGPLWRVSVSSGRDALRAQQRLFQADMIAKVSNVDGHYTVLATDARIGQPRSIAELDRLTNAIAAESNGTVERVPLR